MAAMIARDRKKAMPAMVVGAGINGLGVVRSLARAGVDVVLLDSSAGEPGMRSRYPRKRFYDPQRETVVDALERLVDSQAHDRMPLILTQEDTVAAVSEQRERLERGYHLMLPPRPVVDRLLHKAGFRAQAQTLGARIPRTCVVRTPADLAGLDTLQPPLVIKPGVRSDTYSRRFGKAYRVDDHDAARRLIATMLGVLPDIVVQEWIAGPDSQIYFCLQFLAPGHDAEPLSFVGRKLRSWPPEVGGTACCTAAPEAAELIETTTAFFRRSGVFGLASMEYKRHAVTGEYVMVEPTIGRTDYQEEVAVLNGVNIPLAAYRAALGLALPRARACRVPRVWRDRDADRKSAEMAPSDAAGITVDGRVCDALWRVRDPLPALVPWCGRARRRLQRLARVDRLGARGGSSS